MTAAIAAELPWAPEAEQSLLGALLIDPDALLRITDRRLRPEHLYDARHRHILAAINTLHAAREPIDIVTVADALRDRGADEAAGGLAYLNALAQAVPSTRNVARYADTVIDKALRRSIVDAAQQAIELARSPGETADVLDRIETLFAVLRQPQGTKSLRRIGDLITDRLGHWERLAAGAEAAGLSTGFRTLDDALGGGLKPGRNIVVAGRPGSGKSSLAWHLAATVAQQGRPALVFSMEMPSADVADRAVASLGGIGLARLVGGRLEQQDWATLAEVCDAAACMPLYVDEQPSLTLLDIRDRARRVWRECGDLAMIVVDYVQLAAASTGFSNRHHQIEAISRGMKVLAKELNTTVLTLSQLTRESERDEPELWHLKESGAIEEDADAVVLLHALGQAPEGGMLVLAKVAKNRQGKRGRFGLAFDGSTQRWQQSRGDVSRQQHGGVR